MIEIGRIDKWKDKIRKVLEAYGGINEDVSIPVLQFDWTYIKSIVEVVFPPVELQNCLLADRLTRIFNLYIITCCALPAEYFDGKKFKLYRLLSGANHRHLKDYEKQRELKRREIEQYVANGDIESFKLLIEVCRDLNCYDGWGVQEGLNMAFEFLSQRNNLYIIAVEFYIKNDTPYNLSPCLLMNKLFVAVSDAEAFQIIDKYEFKEKNAWLYAYYHELPPEYITDSHVRDLYSFLQDSSDGLLLCPSFRDVDFLEKFHVVDKEAFINGCKIILAKTTYSYQMVNIYFNLSFDYLHNTPKTLIKKFDGNLELLEDIYIAMLYGYNHDHDGQFLKEIYTTVPSILDKYICHLISNSDRSNSDEGKRHLCFYDLDNFKEIMDIFFERTMQAPYFMEDLLLPVLNKPNLLQKQDSWIRRCIRSYATEVTKMHCLFSAISKLNSDRKKEYISQFLKHNSSLEVFEEIPLTPISWSCSGSAVPMYNGWIAFLESLLPDLTGLKWLKHKRYIETKINYLKKYIETEQINEILRGEV
jgi:hypothetical protein